MAQFRMEIAGIAGEVCSLFDSTKDYCRNYLTDKEPSFSVTVTKEDLLFEQQALDREAREEGLRLRVFSDPFLERAAIQRSFADALFEEDVLMVHGSTVALHGKAYLFTAKCGTGKSTHTRLWRQVFPEALMVNDDKPFLRLEKNRVLACGAPWSGKHGLDSNITVPLQGICILERGPENRIRKASPEEALPMLLHQSHCPMGPEKAARLQEKLIRLTECVPVWKMECTKDPRAAEIAHSTMAGKE